MSMTDEEAFELIRNRVKEIDNTRVYFCLRTMKVKPISTKIVENMKICIAITEMKLPITLRLFSYLRGYKITHQTLLGTLHTLGDKKVITLVRGDFKDWYTCRWLLGESFSKLYYGDKK